jgi:DNA polymerase-3 subunit delta'
MNFKEVIGQQELKKHLLATINNDKVSHAQLFCGPQGSGHFAMAIAYVKFLLCSKRKSDDSCGECSSCKKVNQLSHPDVHFSFPIHLSKANKVEKSDDCLKEFREMCLVSPYLGINNWYEQLGNPNKQGIIAVREGEAIIKKLGLKSFEGGYKVLVMWLPELMNNEAANKLLKLIEEPPPKTLFLLVSNSTDAIIDTILSRTQRINFNGLSETEIANKLVSLGKASTEKALRIAQLSEGNFHKALGLINPLENDQILLSEFINWMRLCYTRNISDTIDWVDNLASLGRERQKEFLIYTLEMFRQAIIGHYSSNTLTLLDEDQEKFLNKFSPFITHLNIVGLNETINKAYYHLERNANPKVLLLDVSLKFYALLKKQ